MPRTEIQFLPRTNRNYPRCHLASRLSRALCGIPTYPRPLTQALRRRILRGTPLLTAPSAVHLTICFTPDSQQRGLSVVASSPLSPLQQFSLLNYRYYKSSRGICQLFFLPVFRSPDTTATRDPLPVVFLRKSRKPAVFGGYNARPYKMCSWLHGNVILLVRRLRGNILTLNDLGCNREG